MGVAIFLGRNDWHNTTNKSWKRVSVFLMALQVVYFFNMGHVNMFLRFGLLICQKDVFIEEVHQSYSMRLLECLLNSIKCSFSLVNYTETQLYRLYLNILTYSLRSSMIPLYLFFSEALKFVKYMLKPKCKVLLLPPPRTTHEFSHILIPINPKKSCNALIRNVFRYFMYLNTV